MKYILFLLLSIYSISIYCQVCTATLSGNWNTATTWSCGRVPLCTDDITIPNGINVTVNQQINYNTTGCESEQMVITISGSLTCENGNKLSLPSPSYLIVESTGRIISGSGGGSSNWIRIGTLNVWTSIDGTVTGPFALNNSCEIINNNPLTFSPTNCGIILLPVEIITFDVYNENDYNYITWITVSERDNDYFILERSIDGYKWETISINDGYDNSDVQVLYSYKDTSYIKDSYNYYRLTQVDNNNNYVRFNIISIYNSNSFKKVDKIFNTIGQEVNAEECGILIYYYFDGTHEKFIKIEK
jgi:hypothetical protein